MRMAYRALAKLSRVVRAFVAASAGLLWCGPALAAATCPAERDVPLEAEGSGALYQSRSSRACRPHHDRAAIERKQPERVGIGASRYRRRIHLLDHDRPIGDGCRHGLLSLEERVTIAGALGAKPDLAEDVAPVAVGDDPDYRGGGKDEIVYQVKLDDLSGEPASVGATLYYPARPAYYLQDRFCTSHSEDRGSIISQARARKPRSREAQIRDPGPAEPSGGN